MLNTADADRYTVVPEAEAEARAMAIVTKADGSKIYYENRDVPDRTTYGTMRIAFENLLYPYRDPEKMF